jgi:oligogalacturonide lyase
MYPALRVLCAFAFAFLTVATPARSASASERHNEWIDPDTGHRVMRLSDVPGGNQSLYFHQNEFTASGDKLVFENTPSRRPRTERGLWSNRIYVYDFTTKKSELLTDEGGKVILVAPKSRQVYHQRSNTLLATHLDTRNTKTVAQLPARWRISAINADETLGAGTFVEGGAQIDTSGPKSSWFDKIFEAARPGGIFLVNFRNGETNVIRRGTNWFNHLQFSPTDPTLLQFCHEGPWHKLDRIWHIRTDGSGLRLMHARTMPMEIAGHEFWSYDGQRVWFDLQMPRGEKFFLASVIAGDDVKGPSQSSSSSTPLATASRADRSLLTSSPTMKEIRYPIERDQWSVHYNISWDGKLFAGDGGDSGMVAHAKNGKWIYLFTPQPDGTLKAEKLVNMAKHDYGLEPNVQFTPNGKWIVFRANFEGTTQVYAVEVAKAGGKET